ncbi:MAG TPA: LuxR family transcriptional regulator [Candidatus Kapabacteria bacterium]|jgi:tetratricopeptide (TPR) repeat protein|nr:LuxR family transcriptional regulator [Candidatus Kapabacteria bacterium]
MARRSPGRYDPPDPTLCRKIPTIDELDERLEDAETPYETIAAHEQLAAAWRSRDLRRAQRHARQALRLARETGDPDAIGWTLIGAARVAGAMQRYAEAERLLDGARSLAAHCSSLACAAQVYHFRAVLFEHIGRISAVRGEIEMAFELAERSGNDGVLGWILTTVAANLRMLGRPSEALDLTYRARRIAESVDDRELQARAVNSLGATAFDLEDFPAAVGFLEESITIAASIGDREVVVNCRMNLANVLCLLGRHAEARSAIELAAVDQESIAPRSRVMLGVFTASILEQSDEPAEALRVIDEALAMCESERIPSPIDALAIRARALYGIGEVDLSIDGHLTAIEQARSRGEQLTACTTLESLASVLELAGRHEDALRYHKEWKALQSEISGAEQQRKAAQVALRAEVEEAERGRERTRREADELARALDERGRELATISLQFVEKSKLLEAVVREMNELSGMVDPTALRSVRALVRRIESNRESGSYWSRFDDRFEEVHVGFTAELARRCPQLTPMELRLCALLKLGMSTKEMAELLATSADNVEVYRYRIRRKLGLDRRTSFAQYFALVQPTTRIEAVPA